MSGYGSDLAPFVAAFLSDDVTHNLHRENHDLQQKIRRLERVRVTGRGGFPVYAEGSMADALANPYDGSFVQGADGSDDPWKSRWHGRRKLVFLTMAGDLVVQQSADCEHWPLLEVWIGNAPLTVFDARDAFDNFQAVVGADGCTYTTLFKKARPERGFDASDYSEEPVPLYTLIVREKVVSSQGRVSLDFEDFTVYEVDPTYAAVHDAVHQGNVEALEGIAQEERGRDLIMKSVDHGLRLHAIHVAAYKGHEAVMRFLLDLGVDVNTLCRNGHSPLCIAAVRGHHNVVELLTQRGGENIRHRAILV